MVIAALLLSSRDIIDGVNWVKTIEGDVGKTVEKGKKAFAGREIAGKKLGVIGLGAIGVLVANSAMSLGMTVYGYDVNLSIEHALALKNNIVAVKTLDEMFAECDYLTVHVPLLESTKYLFNADAFAKMKDGVNIINFSRDLLVNDEDMCAALASGKVHPLCDGFPNEKVRHMPGAIAVPHLGGVDFGKRGQLRRNGGAAAQRLRRDGQHQKFGQLSRTRRGEHCGRIPYRRSA